MSTDLHSLVIPQLERVLTNLRDILERARLDLEQRDPRVGSALQQALPGHV